MLPARPLILFSTIKRSAGFCQPAFIISKKMFDKFGKTLYNNLCMTVKKGITMLLGLSKIIDCPGGAVSFETSLDLSDLAFGNCCPATEPVFASGTVRNTAGVLMLSGTVRTRLHGVCDRCARAFIRDVEFPMEAVLVTALEDEANEDQELFALQGNAADLDEIVTTVFVLNMDSKLLCSPDCKGLCCRCGKNLNDGSCSCQPESDPRFAALKQLLK